MARSNLGRAARFHKNPVLREQEWEEATRTPWWLMVLVMVIVGVSFFYGAYGEQPHNFVAWVIGILAILIYAALGWARRRRARRELRRAHGQPVT